MVKAKFEALRIRKLADRDTGERVSGFHPLTGAPTPVNPATGQPEPWPLSGVRFEDGAPKRTRVPTGWVQRAMGEGWLSGEGHEVVVRPAGPAGSSWVATDAAPSPHVFHHFAALVFHTVDGDVRYKVTHQPDKYAESGNDATPVTDEMYAAGGTRVDHFYDLELEA